MAGFIQPGEIINFAKLAWEIYQLGWSADRNATNQYREFFSDVWGLGKNLDLLSQVVSEATARLHNRGAFNAQPRWDEASLYQIIGDYRSTLRECYELITSNERCNMGSNPLRNMEWNVLVQPKADSLRARIALHNSKVLQMLKPFEIDILSRVEHDIKIMHNDLVQRLEVVDGNIRRIMGVIIPDLEQELREQAHRTFFFLDVPIEIANRFRVAALKDRPEYTTDADFELEDLSDGFVLNFGKATANFKSGVTVNERMPPVDQYVNLLKCVWLFNRMCGSPLLQGLPKESHWPSFVNQLKENLSSECTRFRQELVEPSVNLALLRGDEFLIWPEREPPALVDVMTRDEMMMELLEVPLYSDLGNVEKSVKLLRRLGSDNRRFRVIISGSERTASGRPRRQTEVIDFDITSVVLSPLYALPRNAGLAQELILRRDERIARMAFVKESNILKFQQAVTGFKPYDGYTQYGVKITFVVGGQEPLYETGTLQLWIPKEVEGSLVTSSDASADVPPISPTSRNGSMATFDTRAATPLSMPGRETSGNNFRPSGMRLSGSPPGPNLPPIPQRQTPGPGMFSTPSWTQRTSVGPLGATPPETHGFYTANPMQSSGWRPGGAPPPSPRRSSTQSFFGRLSGNNRSSSISSAVSTTAYSTTSKSSSSDGRTTISKGTHTTGYLHRRPPKPMLVLFTQSIQNGRASFVTIQIDDETNINPDRCNCRRSGRGGAACSIAAIEKRKGETSLEARRYESSDLPSQDLDWNIANLAASNPTVTSDRFKMNKLVRVSIMFPEAGDRERFSGLPYQCKCKNLREAELARCLNLGHKGLWGKVQETYRRQAIAYHEARFGAQEHVVNGVAPD